MKRVYFVRHGEAEGNRGGFSQTHSTPLTEHGHKQACVVAERFKSIDIETVLASTMDRAQETAKYIAEIKGLPVTPTEYFHEVTKPTSVQGKIHTSEEYITYEELFAENYADPTWRFEDGENFTDLLDRVEKGITMLENQSAQNIVLVSHGRLLRFITSYLIHNKMLDARTEYVTAGSLRATNTGITVVEYDQRWRLITWNDVAHFAE